MSHARRANFQKNQAVYEELPLYVLRERFQTPEGKEFVKKLVASWASQVFICFFAYVRSRGKEKPYEVGCGLRLICNGLNSQMAEDPECKLYKLFTKNQSKTGDERKAKQTIKATGRDLCHCVCAILLSRNRGGRR